MTDRATIVVVDPHDALPDVIARIGAATERLVRLEIPPGSPLFVTTSEFVALKEAAERRRIDVVVRAADPLRLQLARMLGLATQALPAPTLAPRDPAPIAGPGTPPPQSVLDRRAAVAPPGPAAARPATGTKPDAPTVLRQEPTGAAAPDRAARPMQAGAIAGDEVPSPPTNGASPLDAARESEPAVDPPVTMTRLVRQVLNRHATPMPPTTRPTAPEPTPIPAEPNGNSAPGEERTAEEGPTWAAVLAEAGAPTATERRPRRAGRVGRVRPRALAVPLAALLALALLAGAAVVLVPTAEVGITLASQPLTAELLYAVAPSGTAVPDADLVIPAERATVSLTVEVSVPTTGVRREPDKPAAGTVRLSNPNREPVTIEDGTVITGSDGVEFAFAEEVKVPAAPGEGRYGAAEAAVQAVRPGAAGNLETGALGGRLPSGVYFSNRDAPMSGGTDRQFPVVAEADREALRDQIEAELPERAEAAFATELPAGTAIVLPSLSPGEIKPTFDHRVGDDAKTLSATAVVPVTALTYRAAEADDQVRAALRERLAAAAPAGYALDEDSLTLAEPEPLPRSEGDEGDLVQYRVTASAVSHAPFTDDDRRTLADDLAGKDRDAAEAILRAVPGIERFSVDYGPNWMPDRMPVNARRIDVETHPGS